MKKIMREVDLDGLRPLPSFPWALPQGWLNRLEACILYTAVLETKAKSVLEVGSWIGRSSCIIAAGVRDIGVVQTRYDIIDFGITGSNEWLRRFGGTSLFLHRDAEKFCKVIFAPGGTGAVLKQNLVDRDLAQYVNLIILGDLSDYMTFKRYNFVFCDCTHDKEEIERNIPIIAGLLEPDAILICDDIVNHDQASMVARLSGMSSAALSNTVDRQSKFGIFTRGEFLNFLTPTKR